MKKFVSALFIAALCLFSTLALAENTPPQASKTMAVVETININTATVEQLTQLPGIGEKKAQAIVAYRKKIGKFAHVDDLVEVKGIGDRMLAKFKHQISAK